VDVQIWEAAVQRIGGVQAFAVSSSEDPTPVSPKRSVEPDPELPFESDLATDALK